MSINKFQEKIFRTGCGTVVLYISAAVFAGGMFYLGCGAGGNGSNGTDSASKVVALSVGDSKIYADDLGKMIDRQRTASEQNRPVNSADDFPPIEEAKLDVGVLNHQVDSLTNLYLAKQAGAKFTDAEITTAENNLFEAQIIQMRMQLVQGHQLDGSDMSDKALDKVLKSLGQPTLAERRKDLSASIAKALKDDKIRPTLELDVAGPVLLETIKSKIKPTDAEIKASYDAYQYKRVVFAQSAGTGADAQIAKAQADLKAGTSFEQVVDRYSSETAPKGKKVSDNVISLVASQLDTPDYQPLHGLKVGDVSGIVQTPMGKALYKLIGIKNSPPPDLTTGISKYRDQIVSERAQAEIEKETKAFAKSGLIKWNSKGYEVLYRWAVTQDDPSLTPDTKVAANQSIADAAQKISVAGGYDQRPALLAWYVAEDSVWTAPGADKTKLRTARIAVLRAITEVPYMSLRLELVDLLIADKQGDQAFDELRRTASDNTLYDTQGQKYFSDINARIVTLASDKLIDGPKEAELRKLQNTWLTQKASADAEKAAALKQQAEADKQAQIQMEKDKAQAVKDKAAAQKGTPPTLPPGATPGSTPGTMNIPVHLGPATTVKTPAKPPAKTPPAPPKKQ